MHYRFRSHRSTLHSQIEKCTNSLVVAGLVLSAKDCRGGLLSRIVAGLLCLQSHTASHHQYPFYPCEVSAISVFVYRPRIDYDREMCTDSRLTSLRVKPLCRFSEINDVQDHDPSQTNQPTTKPPAIDKIPTPHGSRSARPARSTSYLQAPESQPLYRRTAFVPAKSVLEYARRTCQVR